MSLMKELQHLKIPLKDIQLATNNFEKSIGKGGFGRVYKGQLSLSDGVVTTVAVKRLDSSISGQGVKEFLTEIQLLSGYKHKNLISLIGFCDEDNEKILVYEHAQHGSLDNYLSKYTLSWTRRLEICIGAAHGLDYLHNGVGQHHRVIHRDIKSANILLDENWEAKIADLGLSKFGIANGNNSYLITNACGSLGYWDPEYINTGILTKESDIYSFGVVLFEVLCGRPGFINTKDNDRRLLAPLAKRYYENQKLEELIDSNLRKQMDSRSMTKFSAIAYLCLQMERERRPSISLIVEELQAALEVQKQMGILKQTERLKEMERLMIKIENDKKKPSKRYKTPGKLIINEKAALIDGRGIMVLQGKELKEITKNSGSNSFIWEGCYAGSYYGVLTSGKDVILKRMPSSSTQPGIDFQKQVFEISRLKHSNVVNLLGYCLDRDLSVLVYEYASKGSLQDILHGRRGYLLEHSKQDPILSWFQRVKIALGVAKGLKYLHETANSHIVHSDIKSSKIMLCDYDIAKIEIGLDMEDRDFLDMSIRTFGHHAPEYLRNKIRSPESDIYSFGVVLLELVTGRKPFDLTLPCSQRKLVRWAKHEMSIGRMQKYVDPRLKGEFLPKSIDQIVSVAKECLRRDVFNRPDINMVVEALEHITAEVEEARIFPLGKSTA